MRISEYMRDHMVSILVNLSGMLLLTIYLTAGGISVSMTALILIGWAGVLLIFFTAGYLERKRYFSRMQGLLKGLDKPYLLGELAGKPYRTEDRLHIELLRQSNKSVIEAIHKLEEEQKDYRDYIESWIHDVKIPITAAELICTNQREPREKALSRKIRPELAKIENYVELALFYARSDSVYQDYLMKEMDLEDAINLAIGRNKAFLIQNNMRIQVDLNCGNVYCDEKWLVFLLNQILFNAVKYRKGDSGELFFTGWDVKNGVKLSIEDKGVGIKESEIGRIFDKGFTGTNGRKKEFSTGMGLYLCKKLCTRLGLEIGAESQDGLFTRITLTFPKGTYFLSKL